MPEPRFATVQIRIVKGSKAYDIQKTNFSFLATFTETENGVKVTAPGMFNKYAFFISGSRKKLPEFTPGTEFNLHQGDPTQNIRIQIVKDVRPG